MRKTILFTLNVLVALNGCNNEKKPSATTFSKAINQYLAKHGQECTFIAQAFPIDIPTSELKDQSGTAAQMAALEQAGLVRGSDTTAVIHGMMGALGASAPRSVRRYALTDEGRKYFQVKPGILGQSSAICYGQKRVDSIVKWDVPTALDETTSTEVTYTYKIDDAAPWARRPDIQRIFSDVRTTINGTSKTTEIVGLQLTSNGWEVPRQ